MERGKVENTLLRHFFTDKIKGSKITTAPVKRNRVREKGLTKPASCAEAKNDPATKLVANITITCDLRLE